MNKTITVETTIAAPVSKVWELYTTPKHIVHWNNASADWRTPRATNDVRVGGAFNIRMEACDKSAGFDFEGTYDAVTKHELISYHMSDGRKVKITFLKHGNGTAVKIVFDAETENSVEMQKAGWQAILDNFKKYAETQK